METDVTYKKVLSFQGDKLVYRATDGAVVMFDCNDNSTTVIMENITFVSIHKLY